jgi:hypothetical protein
MFCAMTIHFSSVGLAPVVDLSRIDPEVPEAAATLAAASTTAKLTRSGLAFGAWHTDTRHATVLGNRPYPGQASDPSAVADAIVTLLFERS